MKKALNTLCFAVVLVSLVIAGGGVAAAQAAAPAPGYTPTDTAQRLAGSILVGGHTLSTLQQLTDIGPRLTASPNYQRAAEWAAEQFRSYGIKDVRLEPFTLPHGWQRGTASARMIAPFSWVLHVAAEGWTPSTPAGGIRAEVVKLEDVSAENIIAQGDRLRGKIVLLDLRKMFADRSQIYQNLSKVQNAPGLLAEQGAVAAITSGRMPNDVLAAGAAGWHGEIEPLPVARMGLEDVLLLQRWLEKGAVTIDLNLQNQISGPVEVNDVVAEIPGSDAPRDWILLGAHLDSWDFATGAQDNGSGTAQVLEAARAIAALGQAPKRSLRFALWGGEEEGLIGSREYANRHAGEMEHCVAVLNTDNGAGHPQGWKIEKREDVQKALAPISKQDLAGLGAGEIKDDIDFDTDHASFMVYGVPALDLLVDMSKYGDIHHTIADTIDKVQDHPLADGAAVVAVTAWALADTTQPFAPRLSHDAEMQILKKNGLDEFLKRSGIWH